MEPPAPRTGAARPPSVTLETQESDVQSQLKQLLHDYKRDVFQLAHHKKDAESITQECVHLTEDVLQQSFHYHFHQLPDANRAEIINMISNYVREAILPPVVRKLSERQIVLEHRFDSMEKLLASSLELLSQGELPEKARK